MIFVPIIVIIIALFIIFGSLTKSKKNSYNVGKTDIELVLDNEILIMSFTGEKWIDSEQYDQSKYLADNWIDECSKNNLYKMKNGIMIPAAKVNKIKKYDYDYYVDAQNNPIKPENNKLPYRDSAGFRVERMGSHIAVGERKPLDEKFRFTGEDEETKNALKTLVKYNSIIENDDYEVLSIEDEDKPVFDILKDPPKLTDDKSFRDAVKEAGAAMKVKLPEYELIQEGPRAYVSEKK